MCSLETSLRSIVEYFLCFLVPNFSYTDRSYALCVCVLSVSLMKKILIHSHMTVCNRLLASGGYFMKKGDYYCSTDYHKLYGTKCKMCGDFVEGRVVTALGNSYHPHCFTCDRCK